MIVLSGAELVLPDRILSPGTLTIDAGRIVDIRPGLLHGGAAAGSPFHGHYIVPGFIDVHVHGVDGVDSLDLGEALRRIAAHLPRYGVTAFCPTTVACGPAALRRVLEQVAATRAQPETQAARVLPAHLESNFISPEYAGAQPIGCLRSPRTALRPDRAGEPGGAGRPIKAGEPGRAGRAGGGGDGGHGGHGGCDEEFDAADVLCEIERGAPDVGIVTLAPELDGALELIAWLSEHGHRVSLGHSGATYDQALAGIAAGARHATHLFNRMPRLDHRAPGLVGAVLQHEDLAAELICDAVHVHPALIRTAVAAKKPSKILAITDATAAAGLPPGETASLGGRTISVHDGAAYLANGTLAGSVLTMDRALRMLVERIGVSLVDAVTMTSTTPARELGLVGHGILAVDAVADVVVLDGRLDVVQTYVGGQLAYSRG
jgi:N-acetylglucosamine-6-phosphate deacetylase